MKYLKILGLAALLGMALMSITGASTASATTLEVTGVTKNESVSITLSIKAGNPSVTRDTFGFFVDQCTASHVVGIIEKNFSTVPTGKLSEMTFNNCEHAVTVHKPGKLYVEWTSGTNGRVFSEETELTMYSTLVNAPINCQTGAGSLIGTLTGVTHGEATLDINATLTCAPYLHSSKWTGKYTVTSPSGLGISP